MSKPVKISTVLTRAAKYLEENGWVQGHFWKYRNGRLVFRNEVTFEEALGKARAKNCPACLRGALYVVDAEVDVHDALRERRHNEAQRYVNRVIKGSLLGTAHWNDESERTQDEVVQVLKDAAKAARKDGK